jgi:MFS family permease
LSRNINLYPWFQFFRNLLFWQAIWFLYFQQQLSAAEAIVLAAIYDISTTALEVPSGYASDRLGRRVTLIIAIVLKVIGALLLGFGGSFMVFAIAQVFLGASMAFASGTDTSLLYESLAARSRESEIQNHEQRAWRFSFSALAISAVSGGLLAAIAPMWAFLATSVAAGVALLIAMRFTEPDHTSQAIEKYNLHAQLSALRKALQHRTLTWLLLLAAGMYTFSHVPFVFGQPFILEAIGAANLGLNAPIVSGAVTATMMIVSVATSWYAPLLQSRFGVGRVFLIALAMQVTLIATLAVTNSPAAIALLFLRMVPDSLARPYILARIHPLLANTHRATYLSMQSFCGRLLFAVTLFLSSLGATTGTALAYPDIQVILLCYAIAGAALLATLAIMLPAARITD